MIPTRVHGVLDYLFGAVLVFVGVVQFGTSTAAGMVPLVLGIGALLYSLATRYEFGLLKAIPMPVHLMLDLVSGIVLALSPWIFGFWDTTWAPHLFLGLFEIAVVPLSSRVPGAVHPRVPQMR